MNKLVVQYVKQTSIVDNYSSEPNQPCDNGDWAYGTRNDCGPNCIINECSELYPNTCYQDNIEIGNNIIAEWKYENGVSQSPIVSCTYDPSTFTLEDVNLYIEKFGRDTQFNEIVMPTFCFQESDNCVDNPRTNKPWNTCPNMLDEGEAGILCRNWRSNNVKTADKAQNQYCSKNESDPTCGCYNRFDDPVFQIIEPEIGYNAGCWYYPCNNPRNYLVPSNLINSTNPCPDDETICPEINNIISNTESDLPQSVFQQSLVCDITATPKPVRSTSTTFSWIFIIFIVILVIVILVILFIVYKRRNVVT